ncbi:MAG: Rne/Rng family ribonuclease [Acidobacteriota bacterium]
MGKELVISSNRHETKMAVLEDEQLVEVHFQRANEYSLAGSIHKGRVTRVLPGMQSAFVEIGLERDAFLYVSDFFEETEEYDQIPLGSMDRVEPAEAPSVPAPVVRPVERPPAPAGGHERFAEGDRRDRRGRRPRRRRPPERGFPESKYVSPQFEAPRTRLVEEPSDVPAGEFAVLPGETLAKYRPPAAEEAEDHLAAPALEAPTAVWEPPVEPDPPEAAEPEPELEATPELESAPEIEAAAAEAEPEPEAGAPADTAEVEPARMPVSLTATLREQDYRYLHRASRRMRRKTRGPDREARGEEPQHREPAAEPAAEPPAGEAEAPRSRPPLPSISELLREGQEILVQIAKEPLGQKGARITSHITLPGRYVVYMPTIEHHGVSRKVASDEERGRLKRILQKHRTGIPGGYIVRTVGEGKSEHDIAADMQFLYNLWLDIRQKAEARPAPALIHHDLDLVSRTLRDQLTDNFKAIWTDSEEVYETVVRFVQRFQPSMVSRVKLYTRPAPIFDAFNVSSELEKALRPKVWLKSGGYIVINQTEALVAIDINTGKFVGKSNRLEDTIFKTNTEAIKEIVRQIRLRDLGGIIVIDFIDMDERKNRQRVMQTLEEAMRTDRAPNKILQFNDFGLVAITRKRVKQSLERALCSPCPCCDGAGYVKSVQTVIGEILQEAGRIARAVEGREVMLRVNPEVAKVLKSPKNDYLEELEEILGRAVLVTSDPAMQQEKFDLA